ncbi:MAG TPA: CBS domain-containing protein [Saprospiraceae bacterium]|nr:CBS domain-containing protein [Saprospiraceae bacterium]
MMNEQVSGIMTKNLVTLQAQDTVQTAKEIMVSKRIQHIPVVDGDSLIGLISIQDLFKSNLNQSDYANTKVETMMTKKLATLEPTDKIGTAAEVFMEHLFHALPVVENGKLLGLVTTFDILRYEYEKEYPSR